MSSIEYRLDEIGRKLRQSKHTREVGDSDAFLSGKFGYRGEVTRVEHPLPAERARTVASWRRRSSD